MNMTVDYQLTRNSYGTLVLTDQSGAMHEGVVPIRAFPITAPDHGIALIDSQGHELAWINQLKDLPQNYQELIESELAHREFMPEIKRILKISSFITPNTWQVETNRGETAFILKGEEDIRRLSATSLIITNNHGIHFLIQDRLALDRHSRKLLDHFLRQHTLNGKTLAGLHSVIVCKGLSLDADHLLEGMDDLHQRTLRLHDSIDVLVGHRNLIDHAGILAAFDMSCCRDLSCNRKAALGFVTAHDTSSTVTA